MAVAEGTGEVAVVATEVVGVDTEGAVVAAVGTREVFNSAGRPLSICVSVLQFAAENLNLQS